jgi:hypothetical protein
MAKGAINMELLFAANSFPVPLSPRINTFSESLANLYRELI